MLERGKFGIEYDPRQREREPSGLGWMFLLVFIVAVVSLSWTLISRIRASRAESAELAVEESAATVAVAPGVASFEDSAIAPSPPPVRNSDLVKRPQKLRNLLMRLEESEKRRDIEMAIETIETIRKLPGSPAADIDDALARRLGTLNVRRLYKLRSPQWVKEVVIRRGDTAERIASENGTTINAIACLNGGSVGRLVVGQRLFVMNHPRFNLVVHRRTHTADLSLNGKFFRRYDIIGDIGAREGVYSMTADPQRLWHALGVSFKIADATELETLLPVGASVIVSEM